MSVPSFDPTQVTGYGIYGQTTVRDMHSALASRKLTMSYDPSAKTFVVLGSQDFKTEDIKRIFAEKKYISWRPEVRDRPDAAGNHLVTLVPETAEEANRDLPDAVVAALLADAGKRHLYERALRRDPDVRSQPELVKIPNSDDRAEQIAQQVMADLRSLAASLRAPSFRGATCIDIGCYRGENSLAMQREEAEVIGIDPDDSGFERAKSKGMQASQLVKTTLQEYHASHPDKQFGIATVFLWNIPSSQHGDFVAALKKTVKTDGHVIIGYADPQFDEGPDNLPTLLRTAFGQVQRSVFLHSLNRYLLVCSRPKL